MVQFWMMFRGYSHDSSNLPLLPTDSFRNQLCLGMEFIYCWVVGERLSQASIILKRRTEDGEAISYKSHPPPKKNNSMKDRKV